MRVRVGYIEKGGNTGIATRLELSANDEGYGAHNFNMYVQVISLNIDFKKSLRDHTIYGTIESDLSVF